MFLVEFIQFNSYPFNIKIIYPVVEFTHESLIFHAGPFHGHPAIVFPLENEVGDEFDYIFIISVDLQLFDA